MIKKMLLGLLSVPVVCGTMTAYAQADKVPDYSTTARKEVPVEYTWNLNDIYPSYQAWEEDKIELGKLMSRIDETGKGWTESAQNMLAMFQLSDKINQKVMRLYLYAVRNADVELDNPKYQVMRGEVQAAFVDIDYKMAFMNDDLLKLSKEKIDEFIKAEPKLNDYRFTMEQIVRNKPHILPSEQQKLMSLTGLFSESMKEAAEVLTDVDIPAPEVTLSDGKKVVLNYMNYSTYRASNNPEDRALVMKTFWDNTKKYENTLAVLLNGGMKQHLFAARARNYKDCLESRLFGDNIDTTVYLNLIESVTDNLNPLHRYLKVKQDLLGLDKYHYHDMYASAVKSINKNYTFDEARQIITGSLNLMGSEYTQGIKRAFDERWIDIYPNKSKQSGAYSTGVYGVHPYIMMNFSGKYSEVSTLIHELGHSMHSYLSAKYQPYPDYQYTTFAAEIASTFNESLLMDYILKNESDDLFKLYILDGYLERVRATIYRQTLFAEFELAMHRRVEEGKSLTAEWLNNKYLELTRKYYGHDKGVVVVDDYIQNEWSVIPHFYMNYYVFQYSTGIIASMAVAQNVLAGDKPALDKYMNFLRSGGSDYPISALKKAGIDMTTASPYNAAFTRFDNLVGEMEKLVAKLRSEKKI